MAVSVGYLTDFLKKLPELREKLQKMKVITNDLRVYASQLSDGKYELYFIRLSKLPLKYCYCINCI